jgi:hypothetical protein
MSINPKGEMCHDDKGGRNEGRIGAERPWIYMELFKKSGNGDY